MNVYVILRDFETIESLTWNTSKILGIYSNRDTCIKNLKDIIKEIKELGYYESTTHNIKDIYKDLATKECYEIVLEKEVDNFKFKLMYRVLKENVFKGEMKW